MDKKRSTLLCVFTLLCLAMHFLTQIFISGAQWALLVLSLLAAALAAGYAWTLPKEAAFAAAFSPLRADLIFTVTGTVLLLVGGVLLAASGDMTNLALGLVCAAGALGLTLAAQLRARGKSPRARCYVPAVVFYALKLFFNFRGWMVDPTIVDYSFMLFALICFMLATYHAGAFAFDRGSRRALTFYALLGLWFGMAAPLGGNLADVLIYCGSALCMLAYALQSARSPARGGSDAREKREE